MRYYLLLILLLGTALAQAPYKYEFASSGQLHMKQYWDALWERTDEFIEFLVGEALDPADAKLLLEEISTNSDTVEPYIECEQCTALVGAVRALLGQGVDYWDIRDEIIEICYQVVNTTQPGSDYELICPGTMDNYGPHLVYVLNTTTMGARDICEFHNNCEPRGPGIPRRAEEAKQAVDQKNANRQSKKAGGRNKRPKVDGALRIAHIADIHVDPEYLEGTATECGLTMCCREDCEGEGEASYWGEYYCSTPPYTTEYILDFVASLEPDILIYAGDSPPSAIWEETQWGQLNVSRWIAEEIAAHVPGIPAYSAVGNHETYPTNLYYLPRPEIQEFNGEYASYWTDLSGFTEEQFETFHKGAYYTIAVPNIPGLRILAYNSNYGYTDNYYGTLLYEEDDVYEMFTFMENTLTEARANGEKILLLGHHPVGDSGTFILFSENINDIVTQFSDIILMHLSGHTHQDQLKMTTDLTTGEVFDVQLVTPSFDPNNYKNPSVRLFYMDADTYVPLDYDMYHLDLEKAMGSNEDPEIELFYTASAAYDLSDLTKDSYRDFVDRMEIDDDLFELYRYHEITGTSVPANCTGDCKDSYMCSFRTSSYDDYRDCRDGVLY